MRRLCTKIGVLESKIGDTALKTTSKTSLSRAVGMATKAESFADYIAGVQRETVRVGMSKSLPKKAASKLIAEIKAYADIPNTIKEATKASAIAARHGTGAGASYLKGEGELARIGKTSGQILDRAGLEKQLASIEKQIAKTGKASQKRLAKYDFKKRCLINGTSISAIPGIPAAGEAGLPQSRLRLQAAAERR
jgi:hypothetical protein